jgi:predicted cobalt transporter CbtA
MMRTLLLRGMLAGLVAGLLAFVFATIWGEPQVEHAIGFEELQSRLAGVHEHGEEVVSRDVQSTWGLLVGTCVYGVAIGGIFALVFAGVHGRLSSLPARSTAALLSVAAVVVVVAVPFLKYPTNPPAVGDPDTLAHRTELYFLMMAISIVAAVAAVRVYRVLAARDRWNAGVAAGVTFVGLVLLAGLLLPAVNEVPRTFPATVLWNFRVSSFGTQVVLWSSLGLVFGPLAQRALTRAQGPAQAPQAATSTT